MAEHQIESALQRTPPRRVRRRGTRGYGTLFSQFFILPILFLELLMPLWCFDLAWTRISGVIVPCKIVDRYREYDDEDDKYRYYLSYRYMAEGQIQKQRELVERSDYLATPIGTNLSVQLSPWWRSFDSVLLIPGRDNWGIVWGIGFTSILMIGGATLLVWYIYILPARRRHLVVRGTPVVGVLVDKTKYMGRRAQGFYLNYEYVPNGSPGPVRGRQSVRYSDWGQPEVGGQYTILYDPQKPHFSTMYLYADYEAVG